MTKEEQEKIAEVIDILDPTPVYYSIAWPLTSRTWTYGTWVNSVFVANNLTSEDFKRKAI